MKLLNDISDVISQTALVLCECACIDQCVSGSAILLKVLHETGFPAAYPLSVGVTIVNPSRPGTGILLGKGTDSMPGKWPGHLVVIVSNHDGDDHLLIDLTIVQVNGKVRGIDLDPFLGAVDDEFVTGQEQSRSWANGCELTYTAFPADDSYIRETNWSQMVGLDRAVKMVTDRLG